MENVNQVISAQGNEGGQVHFKQMLLLMVTPEVRDLFESIYADMEIENQQQAAADQWDEEQMIINSVNELGKHFFPDVSICYNKQKRCLRD